MERTILGGGMPLLPASVVRLLPDEVRGAVVRGARGAVEEIRLRADGRVFLTADGETVALDTIVSADALQRIFVAVCDGSLYAHADTIKDGYVTLRDGVRVGVAGRAVVENGRTVAVREVHSLCFRMPRDVWIDPAPLVALLSAFSFSRGLLLYAPPGGGKTTILRALVRTLGAGEAPRRVVVVDTRCEMAPFLKASGLCVDLLCGYPRRQGIEIAVRSLGAEVVVCDELCGVEEARAVTELQSGGVSLVATAHASTLAGLLSRADMALLHGSGTFGAYVRVDRTARELFSAITRAEEVS